MFRGAGNAGVRGLDALHQGEQGFAVHEADRVAGGEPPSVPGEVAGADDDGLPRVLDGEYAVDLPHHPDADAAVAPVLGLDEVEFAVLAKPDVDPAVPLTSGS